MAGIILAAAALEEIALHPDDPVPLAFRAMLVGGLAMFLLGVAGAIARSFGVLIRERTLAVLLLAGLVAITGGLDGVVVLVLVDLLLLATLVAEHRRVEGRAGAA